MFGHGHINVGMNLIIKTVARVINQNTSAVGSNKTFVENREARIMLALTHDVILLTHAKCFGPARVKRKHDSLSNIKVRKVLK